jgi:hypothetical protein
MRVSIGRALGYVMWLLFVGGPFLVALTLFTRFEDWLVARSTWHVAWLIPLLALAGGYLLDSLRQRRGRSAGFAGREGEHAPALPGRGAFSPPASGNGDAGEDRYYPFKLR